MLNASFRLLNVRGMGSVGYDNHACTGNHVPEGFSIAWRDDSIAVTPDKQRGDVYPVQPVGELGVVHVRFPGIKAMGDSVRGNTSPGKCADFLVD